MGFDNGSGWMRTCHVRLLTWHGKFMPSPLRHYGRAARPSISLAFSGDAFFYNMPLLLDAGRPNISRASSGDAISRPVERTIRAAMRITSSLEGKPSSG